MKYEFTYHEKPDEKDLKVLWDGINCDMKQKIANYRRTELSFLLRDKNNKIVGGVQGNYEMGWLWVDSLWVAKELRGLGYGIKLIKLIEDEAIKNDCKYSHLSSFTFQAVDFYKKQGYTVYGEIEDYPDEYSRCWLRKKLV